MGSATDTTTAAPTTEAPPEPTTAAPATTTTTTGEPATTTGSTTELLPPTTGMPMTSTTTTGEPETTTGEPETTTGEPETTTGGTTEGALQEAGPYESCNNEMGIGCKGDAICVDSASTNGQVDGSYCAPKCVGGMMNCQEPMGAGPNTQAVCAFDTNADMEADICALICNLAVDDCNNGSACEDIGIPDMDVNGVIMKFGVCTHA